MTPQRAVETVGDRLKEARENAGLSVGQVARMLHVSRDYIDLVETLGIIKDVNLHAFCPIYHVHFEFLRLGTLREVELPDEVPEPDRAMMRRMLGMMANDRD